MRNTGDGKSGFEAGEGAREMAPTPKGGSRRANCPILTPVRIFWGEGGEKKRGEKKKLGCGFFVRQEKTRNSGHLVST